MRKLQQFYIIKLTSERLKDSNYDITQTLDEAKENGEVVSINNSEMIRTIFRYKNREFSQETVDSLLIEQKKLKKADNNSTNRKKLAEVIEKLDEILFIDDLISVEFKNKTHYLEILAKHGFYVNGTRYVPFLASSGMIRKNTGLFINNNLKHPIMDILENERNENIPMVAAKFGAYFSLYSSSTLPVSFPRIAVVPDKIIETTRRVNFVTYSGINQDDKVEEKNSVLKLNAWDGQGLITPRLAEKWSKELELDYTFSSAIIRAPFMKGLVVVFDLEKFANLIAKKYTFIDIYGEEVDIRNVDVILSESMFKLNSAYKSTEEYVEKCHRNNLGFGITKVNQEREKSYSRTSYQFLQVLNLSDGNIAKLCEPTIKWVREVSGGNAEDMLLYASGEKETSLQNWNKIDVIVKALMLNQDLANDRYIQDRFAKTLYKKKKESFMGSLIVNANYQFMISDPYYQACHVFGICDREKPLLKEGEHYSKYWLKKGVNSVAGIRSPIVHHSEVNVLNFKSSAEIDTWYEHINSGIIFPANGIGMDCAIHGGADFDGDLICTINNDVIRNSGIFDYPIIYESVKAEKSIVDSRDDETQVKVQLNGHNSKVGFATNISSSIYAMLEEYPKDSEEYKTLSNRLRIGRAIQGEIIDSVKGLEVPPFREHWVKPIKITNKMTDEEIEQANFYNSIVCDIRPAFFCFLYPHYMSRYNEEIKRYDSYSRIKFDKPFLQLKANPENQEEIDLYERYRTKSYFLDNNSAVNKISRYMRTKLSLTRKYSRQVSSDFNYTQLQKEGVELNAYNIEKMQEYLLDYKKFKKNLRSGTDVTYDNLPAYISALKKRIYKDISSNDGELASYAVEITYNGEQSSIEFPWVVFPDGVLQNLIEKSDGTLFVPIPNEDGEKEYLWERYSFEKKNISEIYENGEESNGFNEESSNPEELYDEG